MRESLPSCFCKYSPRRLALLAEALFLVAFASLAVRALPFHVVIRLAGGSKRRFPKGSAPGAEQFVWAVAAIARRVPWKAACIQQGLALYLMLRHRGLQAVIHYGIEPRNERLSAHVWVTVGSEVVLGARGRSGHKRVASFPTDPS